MKNRNSAQAKRETTFFMLRRKIHVHAKKLVPTNHESKARRWVEAGYQTPRLFHSHSKRNLATVKLIVTKEFHIELGSC